MKKIKEVRLSVGAGQPDYPGTSNRVFIGYTGGMLTNADSSASRRMQVVNNSYDIEEEESTDEESEEDMILNERKKIDGKFSLLETLENIDVDGEESRIEEESFEEIDLAEFSGSGAAGGYSTRQPGPNPNKPMTKKAQTAHHKLFEKEKAINEQRERIALLQKYHQRTTNKLK